MKTTLIFAIAIFFAAFMGCSDNLSINDPSNMDYSSGQTKAPGIPGVEVIWELEELTVNTNACLTDHFENSASYFNPPLTMISGYQITFDVYTTADKFINGYLPLVNISKDGENVYSSSEFPEHAGDVITHVSVDLSNVRFEELRLLIALIQSDNVPATETDDNGVILKLTKITLYRMN